MIGGGGVGEGRGEMGHSGPNLGERVSGGECGVSDERRIHWKIESFNG